MSQYGIAKFLFQHNGDAEVRAAFEADPDAALDRYPLTEEERDALRRRDFGALYGLGAPPLMLLYLSNYTGLPVPHYVEAIRAANPASPHPNPPPQGGRV